MGMKHGWSTTLDAMLLTSSIMYRSIRNSHIPPPPGIPRAYPGHTPGIPGVDYEFRIDRYISTRIYYGFGEVPTRVSADKGTEIPRKYSNRGRHLEHRKVKLTSSKRKVERPNAAGAC